MSLKREIKPKSSELQTPNPYHLKPSFYGFISRAKKNSRTLLVEQELKKKIKF